MTYCSEINRFHDNETEMGELEDRVTALEKEIAKLGVCPTWIYYPQPCYYPYYHSYPVWTTGYYTTSGGSDAQSSA